MEEPKQELKPKTRRKPVRKEKIVEQVQHEQVKPTAPIQNTKQQPAISEIEVAKKLINIYQSAQDRKLQFNLSFEYVRKMLEYKTCYYTNKPFTEDGPNARSFDRVDSDKGYIEGNVVACTIDINGKKSNLSFEEISCIYQKLVKKKGKETTKENTKKITETPIVAKETPITTDEFFSLDSKDKE
jgi:hypothetical protein